MTHFMDKKIKIIIGLGNSGEEYQNTYHNVGRLFVEHWQKIPPPAGTPFYKGRINPSPLRVLPFTKGGEKTRSIPAVATEGFMNQSGDSVKKILKEKGLKIEDALIVHDDSDIHIGEYKISRNRGAAGHKGVLHVMAVFGTQDFTRLRIGIRPKDKSLTASGPLPLEKGEQSLKADVSTEAHRAKADEFVLKNISAANMKKLEGVFGEAALQIENENLKIKNSGIAPQ